MAQPGQQHAQAAAAMAEGDAKAGQLLKRAAGDHGCSSQAGFSREGQHLLQQGRANQAVYPGGAQRVHKHGRAPRRCRFEERQEARVADDDTVDIAGNLNTRQTQRVQGEVQLRNRQRHILQGHGGKAEETAWRVCNHRGNHFVQVAAHGCTIARLQPVRQQFRHGRQHLLGDALFIHVGTAHGAVPALVRHRAVDRARHHHVAVAGVGRGHPGPGRTGMATQVGRKRLGNDVGMDVDHVLVHVVIHVPGSACRYPAICATSAVRKPA